MIKNEPINQGGDFTDLAFSRAVSSYKKCRSKGNLQTYCAPSFNQAGNYPHDPKLTIQEQMKKNNIFFNQQEKQHINTFKRL